MLTLSLLMAVGLLPGVAAGTAQTRSLDETEGLRLFMEGQNQKALPLLRKASTAAPHKVEVAYALGLCSLREHDVAGARAAFARMFAVPEDSARARLVTAKMMMREGLETLAGPEARAALKLDPKVPEAHFILGELAIYNGDADRGIAELREEIAINPAYFMAYYRLGDAYARKEMWGEAIPKLQIAIWLNPDFSSPYILLGKAYSRQEQFAFAEGMLRQALRMDPNNAGAHYLLGGVYRDMGRTEDSRKEFELWKKLKQ